MIKFGWTLSSEEYGPQKLIDLAVFAEDAGFDFVGISDHYSPWINNQGQSPYVWTTLGGISQKTKKVLVFVGVTAPILRYSPAIIAQATATTAILLENRFWFGVGTGEFLNEHIESGFWPHINTRRDMLREAIDVIRLLWKGNYLTYEGKYYSYEQAKIYSLPETLPKLLISGFGPKSAEFAGHFGDGFVSTKPDISLVDTFEDSGGKGKPKMVQIGICVNQNIEQAKKLIFEKWPISGLKGQILSELRLPEYFEQAAKLLTPDEASKGFLVGMDPQVHINGLKKYIDAGYTHIYFHQLGDNHQEAMEFYKQKVLPAFQ